MQKITSFTINHDFLKPGMYISRKDGDVVTYDVRMKEPNNPANDYLSAPAAHTIEHLFATYARSSPFGDAVLYVGPMGCLTGFYFLTRDSVPAKDAIEIVRGAMTYIADFRGEIPGAKRRECGNYKFHDLSAAKAAARDMQNVLDAWTPENLQYPPEVLA